MEYLLAFLAGGTLCAIAQLLVDLTKLTPARILVSFVVAGVVIGAFGWYAPLKETFGCGVSVPLLGFGGAIAEGVKEDVAARGLIGALTGGLRAAAGGTTAALLLGLLCAPVGRGGHPKQA